jgi:hypothetical protein
MILIRKVLFLSFTIALLLQLEVSQRAIAKTSPRVFLLSAKQLEATKQRVLNRDLKLAPALAKLELDANKALSAGPFSVVTKDVMPPSSDKHDYMSQAPYFWPDPAKPNGLPYIRRDGERNPEIEKIGDHEALDRMRGAVETLALAYYLENDEKYGQKAAELLRVFFLNPKTRMNPNLQFAQGIPGINTGRGIGLIETRGLASVVDSIGLLSGSNSWTRADQSGMEEWFSKFLQWMQESKNGKDEAASKNNHGTYYDAQIVAFALFLRRADLAKSVLETAKTKRLALQIEPDGRQPLELARTKAWSYSIMNLQGLMLLARLAESVGVDLWGYQTQDGRSIRKALDFLVPFVSRQKWPYQQLGAWPPQQIYPLIRVAAYKYKDPEILAILSELPKVDPQDRSQLTFEN